MIAIFHPPGENELTGGYLYNKRIAGEIPFAEVVAVPPAELCEALARAASRHTRLVVDSLYIDDDTDLGAMSERGAIALIHHLPSLDPGFSASRLRDQKARERAFLRAARGAIATSAFMARLLGERGLAKDPAVCPPGVDDAFFDAAPGRAAEPPELITVANLEPRKGYLEHLEPIGALAKRCDFLWHIVGATHDRAYARRVEARAAEVGLRERVRFHGRLGRDELLSLLGRASAHVLLSRFESYGMVVAESLAAGVPVVAPRIGEIATLVDHDATGLLAEPGDPDDLAGKLERVVSDPALRARLCREATARRGERLRWPDAAQQFARALGA